MAVKEATAAEGSGGFGPAAAGGKAAASSPRSQQSPAVGARAAAGRGQRTVLQRGRAHGGHRPRDRAGRRGQGLAVQHVRQQGRAGPCLPGDPPRQRHPAHYAGGGALRHAPRAPAGRVRRPGGAVRPAGLPRLRVCPGQRGIPSWRPGRAGRRGLPSLGARAADRAGRARRRARARCPGPPAAPALRRQRAVRADGPRPRRGRRGPGRRGHPARRGPGPRQAARLSG